MESKRIAHRAALATVLLLSMFVIDRVQADTFKRISTFANYTNNMDAGEETVSEIVSATPTGRLLVYSDGELDQIGFVDISNPAAPVGTGKLDVGGEPTSVAVISEQYALVGVNTSESFIEPSGHVAIVDIVSRTVIRTIDLGGQPDAIDVAPNGRYAAIAIENERDEDIVVDGVEGGLPQLPAGFLVILDIVGPPQAWSSRSVDLSGLSSYAPSDPEPEFVDINELGLAVVTLQENNHAVVVNLRTGEVVNDIALGSVDLDGIDVEEEDIISLTGSLSDVPREPDAVTWLPGGRLFATANEGDLFGGSRGFSIFSRFGQLRFDTGASFDQLAVAHGHYPENRSENKGSEPESITFGQFGRDNLLFVGSERGSFVAVYEFASGNFNRPRFKQLLPAPLGPEGVLTIPSRNLLVVSGEVDDPEFGVRSTIMIYEYGPRRADYPEVISQTDKNGLPIPWSALSGMTALNRGTKALAVNDSFYADSSIFELVRRGSEFQVRSKTPIVGGTGDFDPEGITITESGATWIASEGNRSGSRPNRLLQVDSQGVVLNEVFLPEEVSACRAASGNQGSHSGGFEGITSWQQMGETVLVVAQQRGWDYTTPECEALDDDSLGLDGDEPRATRLWTYSPTTGMWDSIVYTLMMRPENASWVGLSEVTALEDGSLLLIERDNRTGDFATLKTLVRVTADALADGVVTADEKQVVDMLPEMLKRNGWVSDKPEGVAVLNGQVFVVTDNDGVDDWSGETSMLRLGAVADLFPDAL